MTAKADLIDPGGHPLVSVDRMLSDIHETDLTYRARTLRPTVRFWREDDAEGEPLRLWFDCEACLNQGDARLSFIDYADLVRVIDELWNQANGAPKRKRIVTKLAGTL